MTGAVSAILFFSPMRIIFKTLLTAISLVALSCTQSQNNSTNPRPILPDEDDEVHEDMTLFSYNNDPSQILNPERGLYCVKAFSKVEKAFTASEAATARRKGFTLVLLEFYMKPYLETDIDEAYLQMVADSFQSLRDGGMKCILRFAYTPNQHDSQFDPEEPQLMRHIAQLKPLFQEYCDVIAVLQAGFVGCWGEWYYTNHYVQNPVSDEDYLPRKRVLEALLDALPQRREVSLRTPTFKKRMYGLTAADSLTAQTAHDGSKMSRISGHNDCFGASPDDFGTFRDTDDRLLWMADTKYQFMGGETCQTSVYCKCSVSLEDVKNYHWTYLNSEYNQDVLGRWKDEGCYDEIISSLGYRFNFTKNWISKEPKAGEECSVLLRIENQGYAAPVNPRGAELILVDGNGVKTVFELGSDPRTWFGGTITAIDTQIQIPAAAKGHCILYLNLPDPEKNLHDDPRFSIRLANTNVWDDKTGYNKIGEFDV